MKLANLKTGDSAIIIKVLGHGGFRKRIIEMGFIKGKKVEVLLNAPLQDPVKYKIMGYEVSLRHSEAEQIEVLSEHETEDFKQNTTNNQQTIVADKDDTLDKVLALLTSMLLSISNTKPFLWHSWATLIAEKHPSSTLLRGHMNVWATTRG